MDWATDGGLHVFCAVLAFLRWRFVRFATDETVTTTLCFIAQALEQVGGVPKRILADRMGCLKGGVVAHLVIPTPACIQFATHYGFAPDFCNGSDPESKGILENLCGLAQSDLAEPLWTAAKIAAGRVDIRLDVHDANRAGRDWCIELNNRRPTDTCAVPDEQLVIEREMLAPLPSLCAQVGPPPVTRKVDKLSCIRYASVRYSVPTRLVGTTVALIQEDGRLLIIDPNTSEVVADHQSGAPGEVVLDDAHYGGARKPPNRALRPKTAAEKQFCAIGEIAEQFLVGAAALTRAVAFRRFKAADVRSILAAGAGAPNPRPAGDALVTELPQAPTRDLDRYKVTSDEVTR